MTKAELTNKLMVMCSNFYLSSPLPENWGEMGEEKLLELIDYSVWEKLEGTDPSELFDLIEDAALFTVKFMEENGIKF